MTLAMAGDKRGGTRSEKPVDAAMVSFAPFDGDKDVSQLDDDGVASGSAAERKRQVAPGRDQAPGPIVACHLLLCVSAACLITRENQIVPRRRNRAVNRSIEQRI